MHEGYQYQIYCFRCLPEGNQKLQCTGIQYFPSMPNMLYGYNCYLRLIFKIWIFIIIPHYIKTVLHLRLSHAVHINKVIRIHPPNNVISVLRQSHTLNHFFLSTPALNALLPIKTSICLLINSMSMHRIAVGMSFEIFLSASIFQFYDIPQPS